MSSNRPGHSVTQNETDRTPRALFATASFLFAFACWVGDTAVRMAITRCLSGAQKAKSIGNTSEFQRLAFVSFVCGQEKERARKKPTG
jgi:hypothetical protein